MELIIGILIVIGIAYMLMRNTKKTEQTVVEEAPYKVDVSGFAEQATQVAVESIKPAKKPAAKKAPAKKAPAKKTATKKPKAK
jgi:hypothetical protein